MKEATRVLRMVEARERIDQTDHQIDVFDALAQLDIVVVFKPLDGLLGAYLRQPAPGVLISTKRRHPIQRFTGAHELGHAIMGHEPSLDSEGVLRRAAAGECSPAAPSFRFQLQEIEADAFAAEFLAPLWLVVHHSKRQGWNASALTEPSTIYQLALRCGCSYGAMVRSLERNGLMVRHQADRALEISPKNLKAQLRADAEWTNPWADVWHLSQRDNGTPVPMASGDLARVSVVQTPVSDWEWNDPHAAVELLDTQLYPAIGSAAEVEKAFFFRTNGRGAAELALQQREPGTTLSLRLAIHEPESGLSRANRHRMGGG